jgi:epoxyqueuosine reductase
VTDTDRGVATELVSRPASDPVDLADILALDETAFRARFRHTPLWRPRRRGILRNAAICAANARDTSAVPALIALLDDPDPLIRGAAAWALGQIGNQQTPLENRLRVEDDPQVRDELTMALGHVPPADR